MRFWFSTFEQLHLSSRLHVDNDIKLVAVNHLTVLVYLGEYTTHLPATPPLKLSQRVSLPLKINGWDGWQFLGFDGLFSGANLLLVTRIWYTKYCHKGFEHYWVVKVLFGTKLWSPRIVIPSITPKNQCSQFPTRIPRNLLDVFLPFCELDTAETFPISKVI